MPSLVLADARQTDIRTFVTLHINTLDQGETVALIRGDDILIPVAVFDQAAVKGLKGKRETIKGKEYVSLKSLEPDVTYKFDVDALSLDVNVAGTHFAATAYNLNNTKPANIQYTSGKSAYLNYAVQAATGGFGSAFFDAGYAVNQDSFHLSFTEQTDSPFRRGLTYYRIDNRQAETRAVAGDLAANSGDLGGSMYMGGVGISRAFDLDPYAITFPLPSLAGVVSSPSIANVYVNGVLVQRVNLPPGQFDLGNLPVTTGSANTQVIVTDAFGRSQSYSQNYYTAANLLTPGLSDYQYSAGFLRPNAFAANDTYGPAAVVGRYRVGLNSDLTAGGRLEATPQLVSGGPVVDFKIPIGYVHLAASASEDQGLGGAAASIGYSFNSPRYGLGIAYLTQGPYYATISQSPADDRTVSALTAFGNLQVGRTQTFSVQYLRRKMRDSGTNDQLTFADSITLRRGYVLTLTALRDTSTTAAPLAGMTATLNWQMGRTNASITSQAGTTHDENVQVSQSPEGRYGFGYSAVYDPAYNHSLNGAFTYRSQYGDAQLDYTDTSTSGLSGDVRVGGALAFIDHGIFLTRPIIGSFALVDVPNTPGVDVYFENEKVGTTNHKGKLVVADLLPNYGNDIRIDDKNTPMNTSIQKVARLIAPPAQAGAIVTFEAEHLHALNGVIVVTAHGKSVVPQYGELTLDGHGGFHAESVLGGSGEFYLENVPPGTYEAKVEYAGGDCTFTFKAPESTDMLLKLGTIGCTVP